MKRTARALLIAILLGQLVLAWPAQALPSRQYNIILGIDPMFSTASEDQQFSVTVYVESGQQPIDVQINAGTCLNHGAGFDSQRNTR